MVVWADIGACFHCRHYRWVGTHAASQFCQNEQSPYYDKSQPSWRGTGLVPEQGIRGCEKIEHDGRKLSPELMRLIPKDSKLRRYPLSAIVEGFSERMNLDSPYTVEQLTQKFNRQYKEFEHMLDEHEELMLVDGKLVPVDKKE